MSKEFMCHYGNCHTTEVPLVLTNKIFEERLHFCSLDHLLAYIQSEINRVRLDHPLRLKSKETA